MLFILILNEICCNDRFCMREKHSSWLKLTEQKKNTQESRCTNCCNGINLKFWHKICLRNLKRMSTVARETERESETRLYVMCCFDKRMEYFFSLFYSFSLFIYLNQFGCVMIASASTCIYSHILCSRTHTHAHTLCYKMWWRYE